MSSLQFTFFFFFLLKVIISTPFNLNGGMSNRLRFVDNKSNELKIAERPYTVFNFATEAESTQDLVEDALQKLEQKAMRRFKVDLDGKKDKSLKIYQKILNSSLTFFENE